MKAIPMMKAAGAGMAVGAAVYMYSSAVSVKKRKLKSRAAKCIHAAGDIAEQIAEFF